MPLQKVALVESLPAATSRKKPITISCSSSFCPSISACTSTLVRSSVGLSRRSAIISPQRSKIFGISSPMIASGPPGLSSGSPAPSEAFISCAHMASSSGGIPMKLPITRETTGWAKSMHQVDGLPALEPVERLGDDLADPRLVSRDPLRREPGLEEHLQAVVLWRVHADEHRPRQLDRKPGAGQHHTAQLGGVGLEVAADRVHVVGARDRPEAGLLGELGDLRGPVDRAFVAQALEHLVGRPFEPQRPLDEEEVLQVLGSCWPTSLEVDVTLPSAPTFDLGGAMLLP